MEFHNPTDVQSVPSVDALHVVNKKHQAEVDALKNELQNVRDRNDSQMKQLKEWNIYTDYIEQDDLKTDFNGLFDKYKEVFKTIRDEVNLISDGQYTVQDSNLNVAMVEKFLEMYKELAEKLSGYEFEYKFRVSGSCDFSVEVEAKDEDDATDVAIDMVNEGFSNYEVEVEDVNVSDVEQS